MRKPRSLTIIFLVALGVPPIVGAGQVKSVSPAMAPYTFVTQDGRRVDAEIGRLKVPENRRSQQRKLIEIAIVRFKSTARNPGPPIFYLSGGPGASAIEEVRGKYYDRYMKLREAGDLIVVDQRGTGMSSPNLECPQKLNYPLDKPLQRDEMLRLYIEQSHQCANYWKTQGVDLSSYNTNENADDIDSVRAALGFKKISLFGASYGSHLALAIIRRHESVLHRVVVASIEGPDQTYKLPNQIQRNLEQIDALYASLPKQEKRVVDFLGVLQSLIRNLQERPITVATVDPNTNQSIKVVLGAFDLQYEVASRLPGRMANITLFSNMVRAMANGDFSALAKWSVEDRMASIGSAMSFVMDCSSGASPRRLSTIMQEEKNTIVGRLIDFPFPEVCVAWGNPDLGPAFRTPLRSSLPTLFLSGSLDGRTPISNAEAIKDGFPNSAHIIVEGAGHADTLMFNPEIQMLMVKFLKGFRVISRKIISPAIASNE
jgi:pimeloyl-ACP methyl ester carboxylesterase